MSGPSALGLVAAIGLGVLAFARSTASAAPTTATLLAVGDVASCDAQGDERSPPSSRGRPEQSRSSATSSTTTEPLTSSPAASCPPGDAYCRASARRSGTTSMRTARATRPPPGRSSASRRTRGTRTSSAPGTSSSSTRTAPPSGCQMGSRQWQWLRRDLARHRTTRCTLAYWHHPRFSSGEHGSDATFSAFWSLSRPPGRRRPEGHDHDYERFAPSSGLRSFVVGTGGRSLRGFGAIHARSVVRQGESFGVLRLAMLPRGYRWRFLAAAGPPAADAGSATCR